MTINPYALCPCGSGKKIKFCCGDLAGEMEKVLRMVEGNQPTAAVRHLEQLLKKNPQRASLLDLKSNIEMQLGWYDQARATVDEYLQADPQSINGWARRAMQLGLAEQPTEGARALQTSIALCDDPPYTSDVLMAIRMLGRIFEAEGQFIPAIAHFLLYGDVSQPGDMEGEKELIRLTREEPVAELLKGPLTLYRESTNPAQHEKFARACAAAHRGSWREAAAVFEAIKASSPGDARAVYNGALLAGFLGEEQSMVEGLRAYAACDVPEDDAIEALALAQYVDSANVDDYVDGKQLVFEIDDVEAIVEQRRQDRRTPRFDRPEDAWSPDDDGPPPQAGFYLLDRDDPTDWSEVPFEDVPRLLASVELFGRETDRPPRASVRIAQDSEYEAKLAAVRDLFALGDRDPIDESDTVRLTPLGNFAMSYSYVPATVPISVRLKVFEEARLKAILDVWPARPQSALGGKSPAELVGDASRTRDLQAAVYRALLTNVPRRLRERARGIWERMGLAPLADRLDPEHIDDERLWFVRVTRVDATKLSDERLAKLTLDAALANATSAIAHLAPELLRRPQLHRTVNMYAVSATAVSEAPDYEAAFEYLSDARRLVAPELVPPGLWDVMEFTGAFDRLEQDRLAALFQQAADAANRDEVVAKALVRALAERGLITEDGRMRVPMPVSEDAETALEGGDEPQDEPKIWTPESEAAKQGKGKIWLPS
jgi:tetratricopeptide (TPR) repeat protein